MPPEIVAKKIRARTKANSPQSTFMTLRPDVERSPRSTLEDSIFPRRKGSKARHELMKALGTIDPPAIPDGFQLQYDIAVKRQGELKARFREQLVKAVPGWQRHEISRSQSPAM